MSRRKNDGPCVFVLTPTCKGCGQPLLGFGTPQGPRCPFEIVGGGCTALAKLEKKEREAVKFYKVQFEHVSRRSEFPRYKSIESVDVHVEAENATDAVNQAKQIFLFEHAAWSCRVVLSEEPGPEQLEP